MLVKKIKQGDMLRIGDALFFGGYNLVLRIDRQTSSGFVGIFFNLKKNLRFRNVFFEEISEVFKCSPEN